jgi:hypothetical protein
VHLQRQPAEVEEAFLAQLLELRQVVTELLALAARLSGVVAAQQPHQMSSLPFSSASSEGGKPGTWSRSSRVR